jgi:predicted O-methyltransferase YrrM
MSFGGTDRYDLTDPTLPPLVAAAVEAARTTGFDLCVHPATGRLLAVLAAGLPPGSLIGESGTGTGAGLAWMAAAADPGVRLVSVEVDPHRAAVAQSVFAEVPNVEVRAVDNAELFSAGPFDLLVHDGGWGAKRGDGYLDPTTCLAPTGVLTVDDFTPMTSWPPMFDGQVDAPRHHWLTHPDLISTEVRVAPGMAVLVCRRRPPAPGS